MSVTRGGGVPCPKCGILDTSVAKTSQAGGAIRRIRRCRGCGRRFLTIEKAFSAIGIPNLLKTVDSQFRFPPTAGNLPKGGTDATDSRSRR